jgi:hypothetical protein
MTRLLALSLTIADDTDIPPSDFLMEGAHETSPPKDQFYKHLHKALHEKLKKAFHELWEDDTHGVLLKGRLNEILNECISLARTETMSPQTPHSEPTGDSPTHLQNMDALPEFDPLNDFAGIDFEDIQISSFDPAFDATIKPLPLASVPGQAANHAERNMYEYPSAYLEVTATVATGPVSDLPTCAPPLYSTAEADAQAGTPPRSPKGESCELQYVPPTTDPFLILFDGAMYPATEYNYHFSNELLDGLQTEQQDAGPSFYRDGVDDAEWNWLPDLP